ncbi:MAG: ribosome small subunit-dependent GTPase A [Clostridia bacterium]|nr:ribosome small subunit-dependent GTPase A [Clostridia bacterium]
MQGIIIENIANLYQVTPIKKETSKIKTNQETKCSKETSPAQTMVSYETIARGRFKKEEITPVVGDLVELEITDEENKKGVINQILERKVYVKRPKIANITQMVLVISSKNPKPDLLMLDKQLAFAEFLGIQTLIVLNKTDLDNKEDFKEIKNIYQKIGYKVIETEAKNQKGIEELKQELKNNRNVFSGNSGVGKSTLINGLFNQDMTLEGEISKRNKRGKNTTTSIKLYKIDENTFIADTPGFSTFSIEEIESKELANYFVEFKEKIKECEFVGCTHIKEQSCGIKKAMEKGEISSNRYERFCKIYQQLKQREEKKKW